MGIFDITRPIAPGMVVYPGDIEPSLVQHDSGRYLITDLHLSSHSGTHIDAPSHYLKDHRTVDLIPMEHLMGACRVIDLTCSAPEITAGDLVGRIQGAKKILLKTGFSGKNQFYPEYPALSPGVVPLVVNSGIDCIGIDSPSIESYYGDGSVHTGLLSQGIPIIELLDLSAVTEGEYHMIALPLRLQGIDGSPARVLLLDDAIPRVLT